MQYRKLGTTGIDVSLICLGTMTFGEQNTAEEAFAQMDHAVEKGVNFFDTAELYAIPPSAQTYGRTEEIIGKWMKERGQRRNIILATKVAGPSALPWIRGGTAKLDAGNIHAACEASLKRLQTDYIDLYQIHWPERPVNSFGKMDFDPFAVGGDESDRIFEILSVLSDLVKSGKVRHIGLSNETPWGVMTYLKHHAVHNLPRVMSIQNPYSLLNRTFDVGLSEMALHEKVGLMAYAPLAAGTLTGKYLNGALPAGSRRAIDRRTSRYKRPLEDKAVEAYTGVAKKHGLDPAQMALAFVNSRPFVTATIIGATSVDHVKTNIGSLDISLSADVLADIEQVHNLHPNPCP